MGRGEEGFVCVCVCVFFFKAGVSCCSKSCCFSQLSLVANNFRVVTYVECMGVRFSVTISFGEAFRKRNIYAKMILVKQKKIL